VISRSSFQVESSCESCQRQLIAPPSSSNVPVHCCEKPGASRQVFHSPMKTSNLFHDEEVRLAP
jgi:hypothetical protein